MLEWKEKPENKMIYAESEVMPSKSYRIFYDDVMYWPSWSKDCTQDLDMLKLHAQELENFWDE